MQLEIRQEHIDRAAAYSAEVVLSHQPHGVDYCHSCILAEALHGAGFTEVAVNEESAEARDKDYALKTWEYGAEADEIVQLFHRNWKDVTPKTVTLIEVSDGIL